MHDWESFVRQRLALPGIRPEREGEIVAELALELDQLYRDALLGGATEAEARRRAEAHFGDWDHLTAEILGAERAAAPNTAAEPTVSGPAGWRGVWRDVRYALRLLRKNPGFAAVAILTLAFGIGGNTAVFTMVDALALRKLPYPAPERLMAIETRKTAQPELEPWTSAPDFFDARQGVRLFSAMAAISPTWDVLLTGRGPAERLQTLFVSAEFFDLAGVKPVAGRVFARFEDQGARPSNVAVISYALWQRQFAGRRDAIGQTVNLDSSTFTVIGVMPAAFHYLGEPLVGAASQIDAWLPLADNPLTAQVRSLRFLKVIGRLRPGVSVAQADAEIRRFGQALETEHPESNLGFSWRAQPLSAQVAGPVRLAMLLLLGAVGLVLLLVCANVANLLLAKGMERRKEIAVRVALGATAAGILRQLLAEGLVLAVLGATLGLPVAYAGLAALLAAAPDTLTGARSIHMDARTLCFTALAALAAAVLAGLPPAARVMTEIGRALKESGRGLTAGRHRMRAALVAAQMALALVLLAGSGLLIHSFVRLLSVNPGFDARNLVTVSTQMPAAARTPQQRAALYQSIHDRLMQEPGVESVAAVSRLPMMGRNLGTWVYAEGQSTAGPAAIDVEYRAATPDYFSAMRIPLLRGRLYDEHDGAASVVVVNESMARKFWTHEDAVGKRIKLGANPERQPWIVVIGVVGDIRHIALAEDPRPELYRPYAVNPLSAPILVIRTRPAGAPEAAQLAGAVRSVSAGLPLYNVFPMQALVERSTRERRFVMLLLSGYAMAALLLAALGVYGTVAQAVSRRTAEIGLRMALGAAPRAVLAMVLREGMGLAAAGIAMGALAAAGLAWLIRSALFQVPPLDPLAFTAAAAVLAISALLACYLPARRATRVDPLTALRHGG
jgi:putative ABC transport system permease protein